MTKIEWVKNRDGSQGRVWNPVRGCSRVSRGCEHCYAERMAARFSGMLGDPSQPRDTTAPFFGFIDDRGGWTGRVELIEEKLYDPLHWRKPQTVFVNSMSDLFHEKLPDLAIDWVFAVMALCPQHRFIVLTKRADRMNRYFACWPELQKRVDDAMAGMWETKLCETWPLPNVGLGVSVEDRKHLDRIEDLRQTPAAMRFLSLEPLLEDLGTLDFTGLDWVIVGGESGPGARLCDVAWIRSIVSQCKTSGTPVFVKQLGSDPVSTCTRCRPDAPGFCRLHGATVARDGFKGHGSDRLLPLILNSSKGGDPSEWPLDLRVRETPWEQ